MSLAAALGREVSGSAPDAVAVRPDVRRVLIFRLGSLGDTLVALPSFHLIARAFPNAERCLLTNVPVASRAPAAAAVLGDSGLVHRYESYPVGTRNPLALIALLARLRRFGPQIAVYLKAETQDTRILRDRRFLRWTGAKRIAGVNTGGAALPRRLPNGTLEPEPERLLRSLHELGTLDPRSAAAWDLRLTAAEQARADAILRPLRGADFFAVSVGTKVQAKRWGEANWQTLLANLAGACPGRGLLLAGAPDESQESERAAAAWAAVPGAGPVVNACGLLTPRESAAAFRHARVFIGHDSGPMHLAAAVSVPSVSIFAARNIPRTWFPYGPAPSRVLYHQVDCAGCGLETCLEQRRKCILSITVAEVMTAVHDLLKETGN